MAKDIVLRGGVDQITPRALCEPGTLEDCYNYEVGRDYGYASIQGFEAFDGRISPSTRDIWELTLATADITGTFVANENMSWVDGSDSGDLGVVISVTAVASNTVIRFAYWNATDALPTGGVVTGDTSAATFSATPTFAALQDIATDQSDYFDQLYNASEVFRSAITPVPGSGVVSGIKWYKNKQTAIRDYYKFNFDAGNITEPSDGQHVVIVDGNANTVFGVEGIVRDVTIASGSFAGGDAVGTIIIDPYTNTFPFGTELDAGFDNTLFALVNIHFTSGSTEPVLDDVLTGQTSTETATVWRVDIQSGTFAGGDASGIVYCYTLSGAMTTGELMDIGASANVMTLDTDSPVIYTVGGGVVDYVSADNDGHSMAGMYRSSRTGWNKVELGHEIEFDGGTNEPVLPPIGYSKAVIHTLWATAGTQRNMGGWGASAGTELDAVTSSGGAYVSPTSTTVSGVLQKADDYFAVHNFSFSLPTDSVVVGVDVEITALNTQAATYDSYITDVRLFTNDAGDGDGGEISALVSKTQSLGDLTASNAAYFFGSIADLWGSAIDQDIVESSGFGIKFKMAFDSDATASSQRIDYIRVRIHYQADDSNPIYFYDTSAAADYASATPVGLNVAEGIWDRTAIGTSGSGEAGGGTTTANGTATGTMQLYDLSKSVISASNIQIWDAPGGASGGGSIIGNVVATESLRSMAGTALLDAESSKYQMIAENAYANQDLESIYGVSGAGHAFAYDNTYVVQIYSGLDSDLDKPRQIELFQFRLWLGYNFGEIATSVAGSPLNFDGFLNAVATGYGRPIVGLAKLPGKTMAVFTDQTTFMVTVQGSDFDQQVASPRNGAIEYSVQDAGTLPIYADRRGIRDTLPTDAYGDFESTRISHAVHPWLLDRLQGYRFNSTRRDNIVATTVARLKSQYRMYFADGYRLTMTMFGDDRPPEFTFQQLYTGGSASQFIKVGATDADVDNDGRDRLFFTMAVNPDYDHGDDLGYVYEDDRGTSFNGSAYKRWIELNRLSDGYSYSNTTWSVWHLYGMAHGWADLAVTTAVVIDENFPHPTDADSTTEDAEYDIALGVSSHIVTTNLIAFWDKDALKSQGRLLSFRFQNESKKELPHILQHMTLVDEKAARKEK